MDYVDKIEKLKKEYEETRGDYESFIKQIQEWKSEGWVLGDLLKQLSYICVKENSVTFGNTLRNVVEVFAPEKFSDVPEEFQTKESYIGYFFSKKNDADQQAAIKEGRVEFFEDKEFAGRLKSLAGFKGRGEFFSALPKEAQTYRMFFIVEYPAGVHFGDKDYSDMGQGWTCTKDEEVFPIDIKHVDRFHKTGKIEDMPVRFFSPEGKKDVLELVRYIQARKKKEATNLYKTGKLTDAYLQEITTYGEDLKKGVQKGFAAYKHLASVDEVISEKLDEFLKIMGVNEEEIMGYNLHEAEEKIHLFLTVPAEEIVAYCIRNKIEPADYIKPIAAYVYLYVNARKVDFVSKSYGGSVADYKGDEFLAEMTILIDDIVAKRKAILTRNHENEESKEAVDTIIDNFDDIVIE